jgi:hypothetical protein
VQWLDELAANSPVRMGQALAKQVAQTHTEAAQSEAAAPTNC